ncbi:MAG: VCBS repeat-containing protein [Suilimivivens sp.]
MINFILLLLSVPFSVSAKEKSESEKDQELLADYEDYQMRLASIEKQSDIENNGFTVIEDQIFPLETECFGNGYLVPAIEEKYHRLALFLTKEDGTVVYRTDQLETNNRNRGKLEQPVKEISAVSFLDVNRDGRQDIILITSCKNQTGFYTSKTYKIGDVLFQNDTGFYRDYRISDKINRFGMNKSAKCIIAFVRDSYSTEFLYTASTKDELLENGFVITQEQNYTRQFEKLGRLEVVPGTYTMADFSTFMIYLVNEQGYIVCSLQPMGDYDNLYALKGIQCKDIDGDGMKDIIVLARYSNSGSENELIVKNDYEVYYQRTSGFETDTKIKKKVYCSDENTLSELVERLRAYWGWKTES